MSTIGLLLCALVTAGDAAQPTAEQLRFFETDVRPVLVEHCQKCHGAKKQWANLRLDSREALLRGGDSGPAVVPGKPAESLLVRAVRKVDDDLQMPPEEKLTDRQVAVLVRWVEMGAPFPAATVAANTRTRDPNHWAFQPPADRPLPTVKNAAWPRTPVDPFIAAKLDAVKQVPAPQADKRTLLRRLTFDLIGLAPTPDEIAAFMADERPDALERVTDRLLADPDYGQRWGRHWLDVARYADSNGLDENVAHGNAWRYRDYVVSAFNRDKPYDRFLIEQLAGDLLPAVDDAQRHEQLIATGFLTIGPKVLAEVDETKMQMDIVDEQIDTIGRAVIGLTLGCARCHDHKFDPIDTADYYGLAGIFKSTRTMQSLKKVAKWHENPLPSASASKLQAEHDAKLAAKKREVDAFVVQADEKVRQAAAPERKLPEKLETLYSAESQAALKKLRAELTQLQKNPPEAPSAMGVMEDKVADVAIHIRGNPLKLGEIAVRHVPPVLRGPSVPAFSANQSGRLELAEWLADARHPLTGRVIANRVWRWHFGRGITGTTDNFGLLGETPSHGEMLDWLALRLRDNDWSLKGLHRLIVSSATYQQSSTPHPETLAADPENRLFGRANVRRLEAEAVRDAILATSGQLDATMGGSLLKVKNRGYFFDHTSKDLTDYSSVRRSLYLPVVRNNLYDVFQLLDFPDAAIPNGDRPTTTVAPQALLMMNSEFVLQSAAQLAGHLLSERIDDRQRQQRLYATAYGRDATADELAANEKFLGQLEAKLAAAEPDAARRRQRAWNYLCHVLFAANEFVYVK